MTVLQEVVAVRADLAGRAPAAQLPQGRDHLVHPCSLEQPPRAGEPAGALRRAPAAQRDRVRAWRRGMIEVDQPQHRCRREPERGDEALAALPDPGRAVGDEEHRVSGVEADRPRVRQQQGEDRLRSPERAVDDRGPRLRRSPGVAADVQDAELRFLPVGMESVAPLLRLGATLLAPPADAAPVEGDDHPLPGHAVQPTARRLSVYDWRGMGLEMAQPRRRLWQSAAGQAVVGPCPPLAVEGP